MMRAMKKTDDQSGLALADLVQGLATVPANCNVRVTGISADSRSLRQGNVFLALPGRREHGWSHASAAIRAGASVILADASTLACAPELAGIPVLRIPNLSAVAGVIAARFFADPSAQLGVVGITGTNGKTSTSHYIAAAMQEFSGGHAGIIGTLGNGPVGKLASSALTTPDAISLQAELARQLAAGVQVIAMEVSSHGLELGRVNGVHFRSAVFTNLTRDHLDFHGDMTAYGAAKRRLFEMPDLKQAVVNLGDEFGRNLMRTCSVFSAASM